MEGYRYTIDLAHILFLPDGRTINYPTIAGSEIWNQSQIIAMLAQTNKDQGIKKNTDEERQYYLHSNALYVKFSTMSISRAFHQHTNRVALCSSICCSDF